MHVPAFRYSFRALAAALSALALAAGCEAFAPADEVDTRPAGEEAALGARVHVDCQAAAGGDGSLARPLRDLFAARDRVRALLASGTVTGTIEVRVRGVCRLSQPLVLGFADSGSPAARVVWRGEGAPGAAGGARLLGSVRLTLDPVAPSHPWWRTAVPAVAGGARDLWVASAGGFRRATVARTQSFTFDAASWRARAPTGACRGARLPSPFEVVGSLTPQEAAVSDGAYLVFMRTFGMGRFPVLPHSQNARREVPVYPWALAAYCEGGLWNARRAPWVGWFEDLRDTGLLNQDGEWARHGSNLLYQPRAGDARAAELAHLPTLIRLQGAHDIDIRNFELAFTAWNDDIAYDAARHVSTHLYQPDAVGGAFIGKPAAIELIDSARIRILTNALRHLGGTGIALIEGTRDNVVQGNLILDAGVNGIEIDSRAELLARGNLLAGGPMGPAASERDVVRNNLLVKIGEKDWVGIGIRIGFTRDLVVRNNEIRHTSYSGISSGGTLRNCWRAALGAADPDPTVDCWNRARTFIEYNVIDRPMARSIDGAAIYVNGQQPGTYVRNNVIRNMPPLESHEGGAIVTALYFDTGATGIVARFNAIPAPAGAGVFFNPPPVPAPGAPPADLARYRIGRILVDEADVRRRNRGVHQDADPPGLEPAFAAFLEPLLARWNR